MPIDLRELARVGAQARLTELLTEVAEIRRMFPSIDGGRRGRPPASEGPVKKTGKKGRRRSMSAAEKKAVSERMRKYWAARRKEKA